MRPTRAGGGEMSKWQLGGKTTEAKFHVMVWTAGFKINREITETILGNPTAVKWRVENLTKYRRLW
jgi:hypothetical protein